MRINCQIYYQYHYQYYIQLVGLNHWSFFMSSSLLDTKRWNSWSHEPMWPSTGSSYRQVFYSLVFMNNILPSSQFMVFIILKNALSDFMDEGLVLTLLLLCCGFLLGLLLVVKSFDRTVLIIMIRISFFLWLLGMTAWNFLAIFVKTLQIIDVICLPRILAMCLPSLLNTIESCVKLLIHSDSLLF